jgi:hypothetical protein
MAMIFQVVYPGGERTTATGYPNDTLVVREVPPGPESCYLDEVEVDFEMPEPHLVKRVLRGPRRPTIHVRLDATEAERDVWMDARDAEGWVTASAPGDPSMIWCVADQEGMDPQALERTKPGRGSPR